MEIQRIVLVRRLRKLQLIKKILKDPTRSFYYLLTKLNKDYLFTRYKRFLKKKNINELYFILSFDCDTHEDADYALEIHEKLKNIGITPVYAVPGQMLEKNAEIYKKLAEQGAEFMNHGYYEHTYFDESFGDYKSNFFYDELEYRVIEEDITLGDKAVTEIIGKKPIGYRAPHFGVFQKSNQLKFIHKILKKLNYFYSSSTTPYYAYKDGAIFDRFGVLEFPVTGTIKRPMDILDTWAYFKAPDRVKNSTDYIDDINELLEYYKKNSITGIVNIYADILHIYDSKEFFEAMKILSESCKNISYQELLRELK